MNVISKLLAGLVVLTGVLNSSAADTLSLNGQTYTPIATWALTHNLDCRWIKKDDRYEVARGTTRLVFDINSHYAEINGTEVALSFPVADEKGVAFMTQFDLDKTIRPLLFPSYHDHAQTIKTICLDPGHGGKDTGNIVGSHDEKTYTLPLAYDVREELEKDGFKVLLSRNKDVYVDLPARPAYANRHGADLFVSLHFNASPSDPDQVKGPETYCITPVGASSTNAHGKGGHHGPTVANHHETDSLLLAYQVQKSLVKSLHLDDRGVRRARFAVLRDAKMPAILIESGYMTNPTEGKKIYTATYRHELARAIAKGILNYKEIVAQ